MTVRQAVRTPPDTGSEGLLALRDDVLRDAPVARVRIAELTASFTPRTSGVDGEWALMLAELESELPPILVHRPTMTVIDGLHRLRAAQLRKCTHIEARFFDGSDDDARLLAIAVNVAQGRPLSRADRELAAERILAERAHWSDRAIAAVTGLSAKKVSEIRLRVSGPPRSGHRVGLDGRSRPMSSVPGRELAGRLLRADPDASLRTVARQAGISPATVADVRDRLLRGEDVVPARQRGGCVERRVPRAPQPPEPDGVRRGAQGRSPVELALIFESLRRDPSLRLNEAGRGLLRMLDACSLVARDRGRLVDNLPPHCVDQLAELMSGYADQWQLFAQELRARR